MSKQSTGGELLAAGLVRHGVESLFMIPGVQLDWAVDGLRQTDIRLFVPRHEQTTTYMADGYFRASGKPGVAMVVPGPGVLNASAGLATAYAANSRVLFIAGNVHSKGVGAGLGLLHEIADQSGVIAGLTKWHRRVIGAAHIPAAVDAAFAAMLSGRPRPAGIEISHDTLAARVDAPETIASSIAGGPPLETDKIDAAARLIDAARLPVLYVGGGILLSDACAALQRLAERVGAPVVMSDNARGALSDRHPLAMTTLAGRAVFQHSDLVVVIGSRFADSLTPTRSWTAPTRFIHINIDPADFAAPREPAVAITADARAAIEALVERVRARVALANRDAERVKAWAEQQIAKVQPQADYLREMREALPEDGILVNELTQVGYLGRVAFPVYAPRTYIGPSYQGTLGFGVPTALGATVGAPGRRALAITGDGGFGWNLQELATARKYNLPVTVVVFNDQHFGNVRAIQKGQFGYEVGVDLRNPDFVKLADAFDIPAERVSSPAALGGAVHRSLAERGPVLIEAKVGEMPSPWHLLRLQPMPGVKVPEAPANPLD